MPHFWKPHVAAHILLLKSVIGLSNLSECHLIPFLNFYTVPASILGYTFKIFIAGPKVLSILSGTGPLARGRVYIYMTYGHKPLHYIKVFEL